MLWHHAIVWHISRSQKALDCLLLLKEYVWFSLFSNTSMAVVTLHVKALHLFGHTLLLAAKCAKVSCSDPLI